MWNVFLVIFVYLKAQLSMMESLVKTALSGGLCPMVVSPSEMTALIIHVHWKAVLGKGSEHCFRGLTMASQHNLIKNK